MATVVVVLIVNMGTKFITSIAQATKSTATSIVSVTPQEM